ncbi:MAG: hypothetical protein EBS05_20195 [Proteobacteria bacterium]|nr:hypothetical protein [Pseudomonadota bacterium]
MAERPVQQLVNQDQDSDAKATAKKVTGEKLQLAKTLKAAPEPSGTFVPNQLKADEAVKLKVTSELKRAPDNSALGLASTIAPAPTAAPMPVTAAAPQAKFLGDTNAAAPVSQSLRFQQLDQRAGYRQNFNSPPPLQVMQDFAFERTGDRVRIVDADGSTYEGTVTSAPTDGLSEQAPSQAKDASARKDVSGQKGQSLDPQAAYHFYARGVNRKLNQAVEFRGEWQPASPAQGGAPMPALLPASFGATRFAGQTADKLEKAGLTSTLNSNGAPDQAFNYKQAQQETSQGRISGRAVVGGKDEFGIIAVPK